MAYISAMPENKHAGTQAPVLTTSHFLETATRYSPGKIRRAHQESPTGKVLYDINYDDGDREEGVAAGRVRRPGQSPPALQADLVVDVKLARKGKVRRTTAGGCQGGRIR